LRWHIVRLEDENAALREQQRQLGQERERLRAENERLRAERERLQEINERLRGEVEALRRAAKRQAAPFSKGDPTPHPRRPGRQPGAAYGRHAHRPVPEQVDQVVTVRLPACCPDCGGELALERVAVQYVEDLPPTPPLVTRYELQVGRCRACGRRVQPRHPGQTSDALGAAGTQVGPRAVALASWLSKGLGVPAGKIARLFGQLGLRITAGGVVQAVARTGRACPPTYQALAQGVRASPVVAPDETGWRVGGTKAWLWAFVGQGVTVYRVAGGRGYLDAVAVLGADYAGTIERDGWAPYRRFVHATHQTCLAHLLRRCRELVADADRGQAKTPHAVRRILEHALRLRDAHHAGTLDAATLAAEAGRLQSQVDKLVAGRTCYPPNRRLLDHLARERGHLFTFLWAPAYRPPTGAPSRPSAPRSSPAKSGVATVPGPGPTPGRSSRVCSAPPASRAAIPSSCSPACCGRQCRSWPTSPSPGTDDRPTPSTQALSQYLRSWSGPDRWWSAFTTPAGWSASSCAG
jgi:transposase